MKILEFTPSKNQIQKAEKIASEFHLNSSSIMGGTRNLFAFLGEIVVGDYFEPKGWKLHPVDHKPYNFDLIDNTGKTWDIKTKMTTVVPKGNFNCTIYTYLDQKCDGYIFVRCMRNLSKVWILGWIDKKDLNKRGTHYKKGDRDDNLIMERDCVGITINKLNSFL